MKITYKLHPFWEDPQPHKKNCDETGCLEEGLYKAPQSPQQLQLYYWFCLKHIQIYNAKWNYYRDMKEEDIETHYRADITWQRPSWRFGSNGSKPSFFIKDPFDILNKDEKRKNEPQQSIHFAPHTEEAKALKLMELSWPVTKTILKQKYIQLVKQHHPDLNSGCLEAEEKLKLVNKAYDVLKKVLR